MFEPDVELYSKDNIFSYEEKNLTHNFEMYLFKNYSCRFLTISQLI